MIRHCSLWKFTDDAPSDLTERAAEAFHSVADSIPAIRACQAGGDIGYLETNVDFALTLDFDDIEGYREYVAHELHLQLFREYLEPHLVSRTAVQFELRG